MSDGSVSPMSNDIGSPISDDAGSPMSDAAGSQKLLPPVAPRTGKFAIQASSPVSASNDIGSAGYKPPRPPRPNQNTNTMPSLPTSDPPKINGWEADQAPTTNAPSKARIPPHMVGMPSFDVDELKKKLDARQPQLW